MFKRLKSTGLNVMVLIVAVLVFAGSFCALQGLAAAQKPPTVTILATTRDLSIGDVITAADLAEKTVYEDENASLYIPSTEVESVLGGIVGTPLFAGQAILRPAIVADASQAYRIAAILQDYPGYSLFPLPMDRQNIIAPDLEAFLPGDLVGITAVIASRPTHPDELNQYMQSGFEVSEPISDPGGLQNEGLENEADQILKNTYPPLAKDLFPQGVRVIAIQGLPQTQVSTGEEEPDLQQPVFTDFDQQKLLLLLVPNASRESLSLALQKSDSLVISLLARGEEGPTPGFTYWDFEALFQADRSEVLGIPLDQAGQSDSPTIETPTMPYTPTLDTTATVTPTLETETP
ncbi:MAG: hypothetical protein JW862_04950 [Anaerolineales bacterium]|nr:hypothetical protein [Anaerolineales bacterium]